MNYETLKVEIAAIADIAGGVPEAFRQRCFEILLERLLADVSPVSPPSTAHVTVTPPAPPAPAAASATGAKDVIPTPAQVRVFMQKTGVTMDQLATVVTVADGEIHFLREPAPDKIAKGQAQWALLLALKSGLSANNFAVDAEAVRSVCQEKGFYDRTNFATYLKNAATAKLFKKPLEPQGDAQGLSTEGFDALGELIKSLASGK